MSAIPQSTSQALSDRILQPLREVAWRHWVARAGKGLLQVVAVTLSVGLMAVVLVGFFPKMPWIVRALLSATAWLTLVASVIYFLRPAITRRSLSMTARQVETSLADTQELISSAVELSTDIDPRYAGSPELVAHLVKQAEDAAKTVKPESVVSYRTVRRWGIIAAPVLLAWGLMLPLWPAPMLRGLYQVIAPWRNNTPIALADITVTPGDITLTEGEPLEVGTSVTHRGGFDGEVRFASLHLRYPSGQINTLEMAHTGSHTFKHTIAQISSTLQYSVTTSHGNSPWFRVSVRARPTVAGISIQYNYPKYTRLPIKVEQRADGAIDAVVGTNVQLTIRSTAPLSDKSRLVVSDQTVNGQLVNGPPVNEQPTQDHLSLPIPLSHRTGNEYRADLRLARSGQYRIELVGEDGLTGIDPQAHWITVRSDAPPAITITAPSLKIALPPDDTVPIIFKASDDFGVMKVEAIVQVDDQSPEIFNVPLALRGARELQGVWKLSIPYQLARRNLADANRIVYQLRATDSRDPEPQRTLTPRQVIEIDHSFKESFAAKKEAIAVKDLTEAIKKAIKELGDESVTLDPLAQVKGDRIYSAVEKRNAGVLKETVVKTGKDLTTVADANADGPMADMAAAAKAIAVGPIYGAATDLATALLNAANPDARQRSVVDSSEKLASAKAQLEALLAKTQVEAKTQELARTLQDMARHEQQLARALEQKQAAKNNDRNREIQNQAQLRQRLDEVLAKNQDLNTPQAREAAQRNQQLIQKVEQLEQNQKPLAPLAAKQEAVNAAQAKANDLAQQQEKLNQKVADFAREDQPQMKQANAQVPPPQQLQNIVKELQDPNRVPQANAEQQQAANQLKAVAQQLENGTKDNSPLAQAEQRNKQDAEKAGQFDQQAKDIATQINDFKADDTAKNDPNRVKDLVNQIKQRDSQLAGQLEQQANEMKARDPKQKDAIEQAQKEITEAKREAAQGDAGLDQAADADQKLADAAEKLRAAAEQAGEQSAEAKAELAAAGVKAEQLAKEQKDLADVTAKAAQELAQARQQLGNEQALQQGEDQAAQQATQTANEAGQTQQQEQKTSPDMAQRAADAKAALQDAAGHEKKAADAAKNKDSATAGKEQQAAEKALAKAEQALRGLPDSGDQVAQNDANGGDPNADPNTPADNGNGDPNTPADGSADGKPDGKSEMAQGDKGHADKAQADKGQGDPASGEKPDGGPADAGDKPAAGDKADGGDKGDGTDKGNGTDKGDSADKGDGADKADGADKGDGSAKAANADGTPPNGPAGEASGKGNGKKGTQVAANKGKQPSNQPPRSSDQLKQDAAAQVQAARQAQDEAVNAQRPAAARQAALALAQAAHDLEQSIHPDAGTMANGDPSANPADGSPAPGTPNSSQAQANSGDPAHSGEPGNEPGSEPGNEPSAAPGQHPGINPNSQSKDGHGINVAAVGRVDSRPDAIRQLGVSASDWAKLPPMTKQDLLNAAQQSGPPEYQEQIRHYFVRIAKLQAEGGK